MKHVGDALQGSNACVGIATWGILSKKNMLQPVEGEEYTEVTRKYEIGECVFFIRYKLGYKSWTATRFVVSRCGSLKKLIVFNHLSHQVRVISFLFTSIMYLKYFIDETSEVSESVSNLSQSVLG